MTAPDQAFQDLEFVLSNRGIHTYLMLKFWLSGAPTHRSAIKHPQKCLSNLRVPRKTGLPKTKPGNMKSTPANSRYK